MNAYPPHPTHATPPPGAAPGSQPSHGNGPVVDAIVADATSAVATAPPLSRSARRRATRIDRAQPLVRISDRAGGSHGSASAMRMLAWGLVGMLALGVVAMLSGAIQLGPPGSSPTDLVGGNDRNGSWSYYHDRDYQTRDTGAKWSTDRSRSTDPAEAALGNTTRWEYDGPYRYGPYGSDAMRQRSGGRDTADPLYSSPAPMQDVFEQYGGDLDPSGGAPVGAAPSSLTTPYYDPYGGYANPYANRIRMAYGEGVGRGAAYDPLGG